MDILHFFHPHHQHVINEHLRITDYIKLMKLITKRMNYRQPRNLNFGSGFDNYIQHLSEKTKHAVDSFSKWKKRFSTKLR